MDSTIVASYLQESEAIHWSMLPLAQRRADIDPETADNEALRKDNARLQAMIDLGERRLGEETLLNERISNREAAAHYVATLSASALERRADLLATR